MYVQYSKLLLTCFPRRGHPAQPAIQPLTPLVPWPFRHPLPILPPALPHVWHPLANPLCNFFLVLSLHQAHRLAQTDPAHHHHHVVRHHGHHQQLRRQAAQVAAQGSFTSHCTIRPCLLTGRVVHSPHHRSKTQPLPAPSGQYIEASTCPLLPRRSHMHRRQRRRKRLLPAQGR